MSASLYQSWGRNGAPQLQAVRLHDRHAPLPVCPSATASYLPFGNGRSYGDSCLNHEGILLDCRGLDRVISFDSRTGVLRCEAGVLLGDIARMVLPRGWFLPVTPGTRFVTLGGAIANDVHGKNHHTAGTFGKHVRCFELLRSDGSRRLCSPSENTGWFRATIAGAGLTGVITWAEIQLRAVAGSRIDQETIRFGSLEEFFALSRESAQEWEYTVAWVDSLASGRDFGRGLFMRGNHAEGSLADGHIARKARLSIPFDPPVALLNRATLGVFNQLYYRKHRQQRSRRQVSISSFFWPLDGIAHWNRLYGPKGLVQHQSVLPFDTAADAICRLLELSARSGHVSFLTVLKEFGPARSPGLMSFPRPGYTLALDFPFNGPRTLTLLDQLDAVTRDAGGVVSIYKDGRLSAENFQAFYPQWLELWSFRDPCFSSDFWRRVSAPRDLADTQSVSTAAMLRAS